MGDRCQRVGAVGTGRGLGRSGGSRPAETVGLGIRVVSGALVGLGDRVGLQVAGKGAGDLVRASALQTAASVSPLVPYGLMFVRTDA